MQPDCYYTYYESPIGIIKIAGTDTHITEVKFIDDTSQMQYGTPGISDVLHQCTEQLIAYFNGKIRSFNLPIQQAGTHFQQNVWDKLTQIPYGKTISYLQLAIQMNDAKATRAVAGTNAKNAIAIIVPCHRVIGTSKSLVGYAGGLWRKKWLLEHEFNLLHGIQTLF